MENIVELLPIPVYHKSNAFSISDELIEKIESADLEIIQDLDTILGEDTAAIIDKINEHLRYYSSEVLGIDPVIWFETVNSLLIKIRPDETMYIHNHSNCMVVAVYYITDPPESSPLIFFNETNVLKNFNFLLPYTKETPYNKNVYKIYPKKGDWLYHLVPKNESTETRYSLSSLAWLKGEIPSNTPNAWERNFNLSSNTIYSTNLKFK
jgi:hypothetical protein